VSLKGTSVSNGEIRAAVATGSREYVAAPAGGTHTGPVLRIVGMGHQTVWTNQTAGPAGATAEVQFRKAVDFYTVQSFIIGGPTTLHYYEIAREMRVLVTGGVGVSVDVKLGGSGAS
jgi:hypothetical protein